MELECKYFDAKIELSEDRIRHIIEFHPELLPDRIDLIEKALKDPDLIIDNIRYSNATIFSMNEPNFRNGKYINVVVIRDNLNKMQRYWIVTAYISNRIPKGECKWTRN